MQIDSHDADWHGLPPLLAGLRARGLLPLQFAHFGNWYEQVGGLTWDCYLQQRPGALRETIRRKLRGAERDPRFALQLVRRTDEVEVGHRRLRGCYAGAAGRSRSHSRASMRC